MIRRLFQNFTVPLLFLSLTLSVVAQDTKKKCFTKEAKELAKRSSKVWQAPDPGYNPILGFNPTIGPRKGAPEVDADGFAKPISCVANPDPDPGSGTTPKFYCSVEGVTDEDGDLIRYKIKPHFKGQEPEKRNGEVYGEFLSSRFSKALGFFADDEWVADVNCPDCEKSLTSKFQGVGFTPLQPAAGIELNIGKGIDENCDDKDAGAISQSLENLQKGGISKAEIDAFKLWLAFIDHGDTKTDNQKFTCLKWKANSDNTLACEQGQMVYYISDMGSTFGHATSSENKARLDRWKEKDPIKVSDGSCETTAKSVGDTKIGEEGRMLLANGLQKLLDAEKNENLITKVFRASRNQERDVVPTAWTNEFTRKARMIIDARCSK